MKTDLSKWGIDWKERAEAAEQKTAELAATIAEKDAWIKTIKAEAYGQKQWGFVVDRCELALKPSPAAQVLAERDARIWREVEAKCDTEFLHSVGAIKKFCGAKAAALSSKSAIGPEAKSNGELK